MINLENVKRAIKLQKEANYQIDMFGEAHDDVVNEMLELVDNFNSFEDCELFMELMEGGRIMIVTIIIAAAWTGWTIHVLKK
jgi:hypothetical protein